MLYGFAYAELTGGNFYLAGAQFVVLFVLQLRLMQARITPINTDFKKVLNPKL